MATTDPFNVLIAQARNRDKSAFESLVSGYCTHLPLLARLELKDASGANILGASDVVNETLAEAWKSFNQFRGTSAAEFRAWINSVCQHRISNLLRQLRAQKRDYRRNQSLHSLSGQIGSGIEPSGPSSPSERVVREEDSQRLEWALKQLPEEYAEAIQLRFLVGAPLADIASYMDKSIPAVAGIVFRALQKLRCLLTESEE